MDGRVYTPEDELDVLDEDLGRARRKHESLLRAKFDGRINESDYEQALWRADRRVRDLERELSKALEVQAQAEDAYRDEIA